MPEYSGSGFRAHNLYKRLVSKHPEITLRILTGSETDNTCGVYDYDGFPVNRIANKRHPVLGDGFLRKYQIARNFYSEYQATQAYLMNLEVVPDIIHIFGQNYVTAAALDYATKNGIPVLIELCNEMDTPHHYIPFPFSFWVSGQPSSPYKFICISERLNSVCLKNGIPETNIWCRPNPINEKLFKPIEAKEKSSIRKNITKFSDSDKLLVYVAKYIERKNHIFLLDVIKELPDQFKLFIAGPLVDSGPNQLANNGLFEDIQKHIAIAGLSERVQAGHGFCENIEQYYQMADAYLFPTKAEGLGTPMLEAVACGVPVVANIIPGITDSWIHDGENGFVVDLDPKKFAERILSADEISTQQMKAQSDIIIRKAGTETIDRDYFNIMKTMI